MPQLKRSAPIGGMGGTAAHKLVHEHRRPADHNITLATPSQALGADWVVASGHKMCGPTGIGFLWGKEEVLQGMPPWMGGGEMIEVRQRAGVMAWSCCCCVCVP